VEFSITYEVIYSDTLRAFSLYESRSSLGFAVDKEKKYMNLGDPSRIAAMMMVLASQATDPEKSRALQLLTRPENLKQVGGTCGMASIVAILLEYSPQQFASWFSFVFAGKPFNSRFGQIYPSEAVSKLEGYKKDMKMSKYYLSQHEDMIDFMLARSLTAWLPESHPIYIGAMNFSTEFEDVVPAAGDLALELDHIDSLVTGLFGMSTTKFDKTEGGSRFMDWYAKVNECFNNRTVCQKPAVFAGVNGFNDLIKGQKISTNFTDEERTIPRFSHWVLVRDVIETVGDYFIIPTWSWSQRFTVRVHKDVVDGYFYVMLCGSFHD